MKISEAFDEFRRREIRATGCSPQTDKGYMYTCRVVVSYFGDINIKKINSSKMSNFYLDLIEPRIESNKTRLVSRNTAAEYVSKVRMVIRFCRRIGVNVMNPDEIKTPKPEKKCAKFITAKEFKRLLDEISRPCKGYSKLNQQRNITIAKMLFTTGLRIGELCALNICDIKDGEFAVVGKSKDPRPCFVAKEVAIEIDKYLKMRVDNNPALFIANETGKRVTPDNVRRVFRRAACKTGMSGVTPHTLRHSYATNLIENGVDIRFVAAFLGHQSLNTTKRYTHVRNCKLKDIYEKVVNGVEFS